MPDSTPRRIIRIAIPEPCPGWYDLVRAQARTEGRFIHALITTAINRYLQQATAQNADPHTRKDN